MGFHRGGQTIIIEFKSLYFFIRRFIASTLQLIRIDVSTMYIEGIVRSMVSKLSSPDCTFVAKRWTAA